MSIFAVCTCHQQQNISSLCTWGKDDQPIEYLVCSSLVTIEKARPCNGTCSDDCRFAFWYRAVMHYFSSIKLSLVEERDDQFLMLLRSELEVTTCVPVFYRFCHFSRILIQCHAVQYPKPGWPLALKVWPVLYLEPFLHKCCAGLVGIAVKCIDTNPGKKSTTTYFAWLICSCSG